MQGRRKVWVAFASLVIVHAAVLLASRLAPYDPASQDREHPLAPPTPIHFVDAQGRFHVRPFVYRVAGRLGADEEYPEGRSERFPLRFFSTGAAEPAPGEVPRLRLLTVGRPGRVFLLGTDEYGRDLFSRLLHGGRISLFSGLAAAAVSLGLGLVLGALAGFKGGWADEAIMRLAELFLALPWLYCLLAFRAFLPLHVGQPGISLMLILMIGAIGWVRPARLIRGVILTAKERDYVLAARGYGASGFRLLTRHVLPETYAVILTQGALLVPQYILAEVTLSFLGLGADEPSPSWGNLLSSLQRYHILVSCPWMMAPGVALVVMALLYNSLANALQEWLE